jgi:hypothetical protein
MIQRPQSIFLAIVVLAQSFVGYGLPIWTKTGNSGQSAEMTNIHWSISQNGAIVNNKYFAVFEFNTDHKLIYVDAYQDMTGIMQALTAPSKK